MRIIISKNSIEKEALKREKKGLYEYNEYDKKVLTSMLSEIKESTDITLSGLNMIVINPCYSENIYFQYIEKFQSAYIQAVLLSKLIETNRAYELLVLDKYSAFLQSSDCRKFPPNANYPMYYMGLFFMYDEALSLVNLKKYSNQITSLLNRAESLFYLPKTVKQLLKQTPEFKEIIIYYLSEKALDELYEDCNVNYSPSRTNFIHQLQGYLNA